SPAEFFPLRCSRDSCLDLPSLRSAPTDSVRRNDSQACGSADEFFPYRNCLIRLRTYLCPCCLYCVPVLPFAGLPFCAPSAGFVVGWHSRQRCGLGVRRTNIGRFPVNS